MMTGLTAVIVLLLVPLAAVIGLAFLIRHRLASGRRWPLTRGLLRAPGHGLRAEMEDVLWDMASLFFLPTLAAALMYALYLQQVVAGRANVLTQAVFLLAVMGVLIFAGWKLHALMKRYRTLKLGYEAEAAAAEELNRLMRHGYWVFHDVPGDKAFNIDHVVVGPNGVFAIETKGRAKPTGAVKDGHKVRSTGSGLEFPGWTETKPIEQARMNAKSVSSWLTSAVGERVAATPVIMLPGWYVDRTAGDGVAVLNEKQCESYFLKVGRNHLSEQQIKRIAHQLDQKCREPTKDK